MNQKTFLTPGNFDPASMQFKQNDVLSSLYEKNERLKRLHDAMKLGNNYKHKVRLVVTNANDQLIEIKAKVWSVTEKYVILKNSITIPIICISSVNFL